MLLSAVDDRNYLPQKPSSEMVFPLGPRVFQGQLLFRFPLEACTSVEMQL